MVIGLWVYGAAQKCNIEPFKIGQKYKPKPPESPMPVDVAAYDAARQEAALRLQRRLTSPEALAGAQDRSRSRLQTRAGRRRHSPARDEVVRKGVFIAPFLRRAGRLQDRRESIHVL